MKTLEKALLLALCAALLLGGAAHARQEELADKLIRLHVVAEDDSPEAQQRKLQVRDALLEELKDLEAADAAQAERLLRRRLPEIKNLAEQTMDALGHPVDVTVTLEEEAFPTREYETFALPAGRYLALRVILGSGEGRNWWCVLFPPLCTQAAMELEDTALTEEDWSLISLEDGLSFRFQLIDWAEKALAFFSPREK